MQNQMSAKDKAFEKERAEHRKKVRELESFIKQQTNDEYELSKKLQEAQATIRDKDEWIRRLLEYMDMPSKERPKEMKNDHVLDQLLYMVGNFGGTYRI